MKNRKLLLVALATMTLVFVPLVNANCYPNFEKQVWCGSYNGGQLYDLYTYTPYTWNLKIVFTPTTAVEDVVIYDRFGAEFGVTWTDYTPGTADDPVLTTKGNSDKVFLEWHVGDLAAGQTAILYLVVSTDLNPAGHQEFTSTGCYDMNSGAVAKWFVDGHKQSAETGSITISVPFEGPQI